MNGSVVVALISCYLLALYVAMPHGWICRHRQAGTVRYTRMPTDRKRTGGRGLQQTSKVPCMFLFSPLCTPPLAYIQLATSSSCVTTHGSFIFHVHTLPPPLSLSLSLSR